MRELADVRHEIDGVDQAILELVAKRRGLVREAFAWKAAHGVAMVDGQRERELLAARRAFGEALGVPAELSEAIFSALLLASHASASGDG